MPLRRPRSQRAADPWTRRPLYIKTWWTGKPFARRPWSTCVLVLCPSRQFLEFCIHRDVQLVPSVCMLSSILCSAARTLCMALFVSFHTCLTASTVGRWLRRYSVVGCTSCWRCASRCTTAMQVRTAHRWLLDVSVAIAASHRADSMVTRRRS